MKNINNAVKFVIALVAVFFAVKPSDVQYVGHVYAPEALIRDRSLVLVDGQLTVSTCTQQAIERLKAIYENKCIATEDVGDADVLVKRVEPAFKARVQAAMTRSIQYASVELVDGIVDEGGL